VKPPLEELGFSELTSEQIEMLCAVAEKAARNHVLSRVPPRKVSVLNITVDAEGLKPVTVNVEVEVVLSPLMKGYDAEKLTDEATKEAFKAVETYLRELACKSAR
jgi:hypothetical protein